MVPYPIERLRVYNATPGITEIYWDMHPQMQDTGDYSYQLQINRTPNLDDHDWENVGGPQMNVAVLYDSENQVHGFKLDKYYRIILTTSRGTYISPSEGCFGQLTREEWKLYREIVRKELLRHSKVSVHGVLLKRRTSGPRCPACYSNGGGSANSACPYCYGTGFEGGYYTPMHMQLMELSPSQKQEMHASGNVITFNTAMDRYQARALGIPEISKDDIYVDLTTGQRFIVNVSPVIAQLRRVPAVRQVDMQLLPASDNAYNVPLETEKDNRERPQTEEGCGYKALDHNYPEENGLQYVDKDGVPIAGATVSVYDGRVLDELRNITVEQPTPVFTTKTNAFGRWEAQFKATVGDYTVAFEKHGLYGPDYVELTITPDELETIQEVHEYTRTEYLKSANYLEAFF